jgi:hypothetical protein
VLLILFKPYETLLFSILHVHLSHRRCLCHHRSRPTHYARLSTISDALKGPRSPESELHDGEGSETGEGGTDEFQDEEVTRIVGDDEAEPEHSSTRSSGGSGAPSPPTTQAANVRRCVGPGQARNPISS